MYTNLRYLLFISLFFCFVNQTAFGQEEQNKNGAENNINSTDSLAVLNKGSLDLAVIDTTKTDSIKVTPEYLEDNIIHKSKDYLSKGKIYNPQPLEKVLRLLIYSVTNFQIFFSQ